VRVNEQDITAEYQAKVVETSAVAKLADNEALLVVARLSNERPKQSEKVKSETEGQRVRKRRKRSDEERCACWVE
jgi:hypothetical protein